MFKIFFSVLIVFFKFFSFILIPLLFLLLIIFIVFLYHFFYQIIKYKKKIPHKDKKNNEKKPSFLVKIFLLFPKQLATDILNNNPYEFKEYGLHMICGEQGSGKTITMVYLLNEWAEMYPKLQIYSNMQYKYMTGSLTHWKQMLERSNGIYGVVEAIDEIQSWFSSNESKDFPVEMLSEISQQRKQRKCILGTAQVFSRIAKPLREQTSFVYLPMTFLGCLTIVRVSKVQYWNDEKQTFTKYIRTFFFIHNKELRNSFDTYEKIKRYKEKGFNINNQLKTDNK